METMHAYLNEIIAFHHVAKHGGYTQAAKIMGTSKSQLSRQIKTLEAYLNTPLFHRNTRNVKLTEEGESLFFFSESFVKLSTETAGTMKELVNEKAGLIRITAPSSLGEWFAVPLIHEFKVKLPDIRIEIDLNNQKRSLIEDNYDFALRALEDNDPELVSRSLGKVRDVIVATPAYLKKHPVKGRPETLREHNCLVNSHKKKWSSWKIYKGQTDHSVEVQGNYASSNYSSTKILCLGSLGIAKLPYYLVKDEIESGKLVSLFEDYTVSTHNLYLVYPHRSYRPAKQKVFKEILLLWLESQQYAFIQS